MGVSPARVGLLDASAPGVAAGALGRAFFQFFRSRRAGNDQAPGGAKSSGEAHSPRRKYSPNRIGIGEHAAFDAAHFDERKTGGGVSSSATARPFEPLTGQFVLNFETSETGQENSRHGFAVGGGMV